MVHGSKRRSSATITCPPPPPPPPPPPSTAAAKAQPPLAAEELTSLLRLLASALSSSFRFHSSADLLLLPDQSLNLDSSLSSAARSLSDLLSLLPPHFIPLDLPPPLPSSAWYPRFVSSAVATDDRRWVETFRMSKRSFDALLLALAPTLQSNLSIATAVAVPPDVKLCAALFRLAHAAPYNTIARRFGLPSPDVACRAFYEVCKAVVDRLGHLFELSSDLHRVVRGFDRLSLPNCCGVLAFTRFTVEGSSRGGSVIAQGLVDSDGKFLDISAGWHGLMTPAQIVIKTNLCKTLAMVLGTDSTMELPGGSVPRYVVGGSCCPLLPWLLTPFRGAESSYNSSKAMIFNNVHTSGLELANKAFERLRLRWHLLQTSWKEDCADALPFVVVMGCLLHNFLVKCGEQMEDATDTRVGHSEFPDFDGKDDETGERMREVLASHLSLINSE